jgi:hypothetical protein
MPEHVQYEDDDLFNPETHHESSDVPVRPLWWAVIIFVIFAIVTHIVLYFMYKGLAKAERNRMDPPQTNVARPANAGIPQNQPLLQPFPQGTTPPQRTTPVSDMVDMRRQEEKALTTYGWVDQQHGVVHIPIDVAKDLAVQRLKAPVTAPLVPPTPAPPGTTPSPTGQPISPDTGAIAPATTTTATTTGGTQ